MHFCTNCRIFVLLLAARNCIACISAVVLFCTKGLICVARTCRSIDIRSYTESSDASLICQVQRVTYHKIEKINAEAHANKPLVDNRDISKNPECRDFSLTMSHRLVIINISHVNYNCLYCKYISIVNYNYFVNN